MIDFQKAVDRLRETVGDKTCNHCINVMNEAVKLAKFYNIDEEKAGIAGLLHDCGKFRNTGDDLTHASLGAQLASSNYGVEDVDILNAIRYHTTGREAMTQLEKIVFIADKIEVNRSYKGVEELRHLAYYDIDKAIIKSIESTIEYVKQKNSVVDIESVKTLNYLMKEGGNG